MGRPNINRLPQYLRRRGHLYFLDYCVTVAGQRRRVRENLGPITLALAKDICAKKTAQLAKARYLESSAPLNLSVAIKDFVAHKSLRKKTWKDDQERLRWIQHLLGDLVVQDLTTAQVDDLVSNLAACGPAGRPLEKATINRYLASLKSMTRFAFLNRRWERDPLEGYKKLPEDNERNRVLSLAEFRHLLQACAGHLAPMVQVAWAVGMRKGEIVNLRWSQVDLEQGLIRLEATDTKNRSYREVPLDAGLLALFRGLPRLAGEDRVFFYWRKPVEAGTSVALQAGSRALMQSIRTAFNNAVKRAGLEDFRFHDLRHCAITNMRRAGVDQVTIMSITGHKTAQMFKRYNTVDLGDKHRAMGKLGRYWEEQMAA